MTKDIHQPYWGLTPDFRRANVRLSAMPFQEEDWRFQNFLGNFGRLIMAHSSLDGQDVIGAETMLQPEDLVDTVKILVCGSETLMKFADVYPTGFDKDMNSEYELDPELFGDIEYYYERENKKKNPLTGNALYRFAKQEIKTMQTKGMLTTLGLVRASVFIQNYFPKPWEGYTLCSVGLSPDYGGDNYYERPARLSILEEQEFLRLKKLLDSAFDELDSIVGNFEY